MSLSLLDLLSCSLAVVVILLVIALNTGQGTDGNIDKTTIVELLVYGSNEIKDDEFQLKWKEITEDITMIRDNKIYKLNTDFSTIIDSLEIKASIIPSLKIPDTLLSGINYKQHMSMEFTFQPIAKGTILSTSISNYLDDEMVVECRLTDTQSKKGYTKSKPAFINLSKPISINIKYDNGTKVEIIDKKGRIETIHFSNK